MRGAYPLLLHQNGWGAGGCRDPSALLRSVGVDLSRGAAHASRQDNEYPLATFSFSQEYPQPAATHTPRPSRAAAAPTASPRHQHLSRAGSAGRRDAHVLPHAAATCSPAGGATPRGSPRTCSPRAVYGGRRQEGEVRGGGVEVALQEEERGFPVGQESLGRCRGAGGGGPPGLMLPTLVGGSAPSELSLCCSTPEALQDEDRVRQEPEPGLMGCCDAKVSCCPCFPCLGPYCPVGHMNTVCMALICSGIIIFIVLSPLLHYLIPT